MSQVAVLVRVLCVIAFVIFAFSFGIPELVVFVQSRAAPQTQVASERWWYWPALLVIIGVSSFGFGRTMQFLLLPLILVIGALKRLMILDALQEKCGTVIGSSQIVGGCEKPY